MARPLRLEYAGALYHVTARGDRRERIYGDDEDRREWLEQLGEVCGRYNWIVHGYCQMTNHYHLVVETPDGNLSRGMHQLNGQYTQYFNRRHHLVGHLFQGRYKAILVQKEGHLTELTRYVVLNPVRAGMVDEPSKWIWSSFRCMVGASRKVPVWLDIDWTLSQFGGERAQAIEAFTQFVYGGIGQCSPLLGVVYQAILGDDEFITRIRSRSDLPERLSDVSKAQRKAVAKPLEEYGKQFPDRSEAMARAYLSGAYSMNAIAGHFGVHAVTVGRAVRKMERERRVLECWN